MFIINPSINYLLLNIEKTKYISLSNDDFKSTEIDSIGTKIITTKNFIKKNFNKECETQILSIPQMKNIPQTCKFDLIYHEQNFIPIYHNIYFLNSKSPLIITEICENKKPQNHTIEIHGILEIESKCHINTSKIEIHSKTKYKIISKDLSLSNSTVNNFMFETLIKKINKIYEFLNTQSNENEYININNKTSNDYETLLKQANENLQLARKPIVFSPVEKYDGLDFIANIKKIIIISSIIISVIISLFVSNHFLNCFNCLMFKCKKHKNIEATIHLNTISNPPSNV